MTLKVSTSDVVPLDSSRLSRLLSLLFPLSRLWIGQDAKPSERVARFERSIAHHVIYNSHHLVSPTRPLIIYFPPTGVHLRHTHRSIPSILLSHPLATINYRWNCLPSPPKSIPMSNSSPCTTITASNPFPTPLHDTLQAYTWLTTQYLPSLTSASSPPPFSSTQDAYPTPPPSPRSPYASSPPRSKTTTRPLILYGSHLGGTLATSLALTECRDSKNVPFNIAGLIVRDGIFDWTSVATFLPSSTPSSTSCPAPDSSVITTEELTQPWTLKTLHALKKSLFSQPSYAFDSFASPTLFFRTPSVTVPTARYFPGCEPPGLKEKEVDIEALSLSEDEYAVLRSAEFDGIKVPEPGKTEEKEKDGAGRLDEAEMVRSYDVKFPPTKSGLKIPRSLFLFHSPRTSCPSDPTIPSSRSRPSTSSRPSSSASLSARRSARRRSEGTKQGAEADGWEEGDDELVNQTREMVRLMRRSVVLHEFKEKVLWDEDADPEGQSEERVQFVPLKAGGEELDMERIVEEWLEDGGVE